MYRYFTFLIFNCFILISYGQDWPDRKDMGFLNKKTFENSILIIEDLFPKWIATKGGRFFDKEDEPYLFMMRKALSHLRYNPGYDFSDKRLKEYIGYGDILPDRDELSLYRILGEKDLLVNKVNEKIKKGSLSGYQAFDLLAYQLEMILPPQKYYQYLINTLLKKGAQGFHQRGAFRAVREAIKLGYLNEAEKILNLLNKNFEIKKKSRNDILYNYAKILILRGKHSQAKGILNTILRDIRGKKVENYAGQSLETYIKALIEYIAVLSKGDYSTTTWFQHGTHSNNFHYTGNWALNAIDPAVAKSFGERLNELLVEGFPSRNSMPNVDLNSIIKPHKKIIVKEMIKLMNSDPTIKETQIAVEILFREANENTKDLILAQFNKDWRLLKAAFKADKEGALKIFQSRIHACPANEFLVWYAIETIVEHNIESAYPVLLYFSTVGSLSNSYQLGQLFEGLKVEQSVLTKKITALITKRAFLSHMEQAKKYESLDAYTPELAEIAFKSGNKEGLEYILNMIKQGKKDKMAKTTERIVEIFNKASGPKLQVKTVNEIYRFYKKMRWDLSTLKWQ